MPTDFGLPDHGVLHGLRSALWLSLLWFILPSYRSKKDQYDYVTKWSLSWTWNMGWRLGRHNPFTRRRNAQG